MRGDITDRLTDLIDSVVADQLEYEETHTDAGDNYSHMPREGSWIYYNCDQRLADFIETHEIEADGLEIDKIAELVLENFEMVSRHSLSTVPDDVFSIASYPVGEIEVILPYSEIQRVTRLRLNESRAARLGLDGGKADEIIIYAPSDTVWSAEIDAEALADLIDDHVSSYG